MTLTPRQLAILEALATKSNREVSNQFEVDYGTVAAAKRLLDIGGVFVKKRERLDWSGVDWNERDSQISKKLGCSTPAVRLARARRDVPRIPRACRKGIPGRVPNAPPTPDEIARRAEEIRVENGDQPKEEA